MASICDNLVINSYSILWVIIFAITPITIVRK